MIKKRSTNIIVFIILLIGACFYVYKNYAVKLYRFETKEINIDVYSNYPLEELRSEVEPCDWNIGGDSGAFISSNDLNEDMGPFYKFWVDIVPKDTSYKIHNVSFRVADFGKYADHWVYLYEGISDCEASCMLGFYQGDLTYEEVKEAIYSLKLTMYYQNKDEDSFEYEIDFPMNKVRIYFEDYPTD